MPETVAVMPLWLKRHLAFMEAMAVECVAMIEEDVHDRTHPPLLAFPVSLDPFTMQEIVSDYVEATVQVENVKPGDVAGLKARVVALLAAKGVEVIL